MLDGSLPTETFKHYVVQDALYLTEVREGGREGGREEGREWREGREERRTGG